MILIVTNRTDIHADHVISMLTKRAAPFVRWNTEDFPLGNYFEALFSAQGYRGAKILTKAGRPIELEMIDAVWYRRPLPGDFGNAIKNPTQRAFAEHETKEAKTGIWQLMSACNWVNHPDANRVASNKLHQLKVAAEFGFTIPATLVSNSPVAIRQFYDECQGEMVFKRLGGGTIDYADQVEVLYTHKINASDLDNLEDIVCAPGIFQEYVPKRVETRITIVGDEVFACEIDSQSNPATVHDWRRDFANTRYRTHELPVTVAKKCLDFVRMLNLKFGALDFVIRPNSAYVFLEINPNGQWLWIENLTSLPIGNAIAALLTRRTL
jgi:glutathione synthase/RimK-type ligase-like ATP-grasp enzyme